MTYERSGLNIPRWQIEVPQQGMATYSGKPLKGVDPGTVSFAISPSGHDKLKSLLEASHGLQPCETKSKGIANMGQKTIAYTPAGGPEQRCSFNYSDNRALSDAAEYFIALANTLQAGQQLDYMHRYDRLGLDAVITQLATEVKDHRAVELATISSTLQRLVEDRNIMERVRSRAQHLLDLAAKE